MIDALGIILIALLKFQAELYELLHYLFLANAKYISYKVLWFQLLTAELGDYNVEEHGPGYLSEFRFVPQQTDEMLREVEELHKKNRSLDA